jgi:hypothetical protein
MTPRRNGNKWTVSELNSLQREYELLELTIQEIALKHERTAEAILYKLYGEQFIDEFHVARGYPEYAEQLQLTTQQDLIEPSISCCDFNSYEENTVLSDRVSRLETDISDIKSLVQQLLKHKSQGKREKSKKTPLRQYLNEC